MESVTDAEAFAAMRSLAKSEGTAVEPATSVGICRPGKDAEHWRDQQRGNGGRQLYGSHLPG